MFASDMNSVREASRVTTAGMMLFPIQFTWPYGEEEVSSFLVEGAPMSFKPFVPYHMVAMSTSFSLMVNGDMMNGNLTRMVQPRLDVLNSMEVDTGLTHRISAVTLNQAMPRISEEDVQACHHRISVFLAAHTAYELLPESGKVVALDVNLPVKQAFHILSEQGIALAPLWDNCKGKFVGVLSASDFILILRELGNHGSNLTEEELETHTISAWKEGKAYMNRQVDGHGRPIPKHLIYAGPCDNLKDVALKILQSGVAIVPVINSSSEDGSFPQLLHLASLSGILKCLCRYFKHCSGSLPVLQLPIYAIPLGTWVPRIGESSSQPFAMLRPTASLSSALNMLVQAQVSSIPIVDDNDSLLDIYSRSDITALAKGRAYTHNLNEMTVYQALQLGQDSNIPYEMRSQRCVRRLVIVEAGSNRVEGVVSLTDVFRPKKEDVIYEDSVCF
ncbi:hypothetical protein CXB51_025597 [Gossypium anomalum]|uniref:CBS domain-containing protein n=1 Tax=Gossypium anomalum TaxID=47600 RepID=A0A8J5Y3G4_9ROSI|nr:hypothetical protein CXB51_025597 [Gossypium anomalum]